MNDLERRTNLASAALAGLAVGLGLGAWIGGAGAAHAQPPAPVCQEDDPCWDAERDGNGTVGPDWDCATMGDLICPIDHIPEPGENPFSCHQTWWGSWSCTLTVNGPEGPVVLR